MESSRDEYFSIRFGAWYRTQAAQSRRVEKLAGSETLRGGGRGRVADGVEYRHRRRAALQRTVIRCRHGQAPCQHRLNPWRASLFPSLLLHIRARSPAPLLVFLQSATTKMTPLTTTVFMQAQRGGNPDAGGPSRDDPGPLDPDEAAVEFSGGRKGGARMISADLRHDSQTRL